MRTSSRLPVVKPVLLLAAATVVLRLTDLDAAACRLFFGGAGEWPMLHAQPFRFFYDYGPLPGYLIGFAGLAIWLAGLIFDRDLARRGFFCMMLVLLGPGILVNGILKPYVSRPRPCQTIEFRGQATVQQATDVSFESTEQASLVCKSFPSGHASMGFVTLAIPLLLRRRRSLFALSLGVAISWGLLIGASRVVQGRHFPTDILWSAAIIYLLAVALYYLSGLHRVKPFEHSIQRLRASLPQPARKKVRKSVGPIRIPGYQWSIGRRQPAEIAA